MATPTRKLWAAVVALTSICCSTSVFAGSPGGVIVYGPGSTSVPTLGGSALIVLAILLAVIAFRVMRTQRHKGVNLVVALTAITALASGVGGINLMSDAWAITGNFVNMGAEGGGSVQLAPGYNQVTNTTGIPQKVLDIQFSPGCGTSAPNGGIAALANGGTGVGECNDNPSTTVPPSAYCTLDIFCNNP
jgi:IPTL-CTERM motif